MVLGVETDFDVAILGGGPVACAIARDATGRGLRVVLCAPDDFGGDVKQHILAGGMRTRNPAPADVMAESEIMQRICPQINLHNLPTRQNSGFLKRLFSKHRSPAPCLVSPGNAHRFAMLNARDAAERGAVMLPNTPVRSVQAKDDRWHLKTASSTYTCRILVDTRITPEPTPNLARVALFERCTPLNPPCDQTPSATSFCIEFCDQTAAVGMVSQHPPTESELQTRAAQAGLQKCVWMSEPFAPQVDDRDLSITGTPPLFSISGTHTFGWRKLAESVVAEMAPFARLIGKPWTAFSTLPGGDFHPAIGTELLNALFQKHPEIPQKTLTRLFKSYGTECEKLLNSPHRAGQKIATDLYEAEVRWLQYKEWASTAQDIIWRRTLLGMHMTQAEVSALKNWLAQPQNVLR